ncbi:MAG: site-specific integrase, partial [Candidatus Acidiferrales bacterium]
TNPIRQVPRRKENNARVRFLDEAEEARLRAKIRESYAEREPEFDLALHTGMRRSEQYGLRWENVNLRLGIITIPCSKHGERRYEPVNSQARAALESLRQQRDGSERLIPRGHGRRWFERAVREAGIVDFHWHDLRHTFASRLVMAGVDLRTVQELLGHKTITMTVRYSHLAPAHLQEAVDRLAEKPTTTRTATGADRPFVTEGAYVH